VSRVSGTTTSAPPLSLRSDGWREVTLGDLGRYWNGRGFKKSEWSPNGRPIIRIQDLTGSGDTPNHFEGFCDPRHVVHDGDLLVSWAATIGVFVWRGPEAVLNQHIFKVESAVNSRFHRYVIEAVLDGLRRQSHGTGMVHITRGRFLRTPVLLPPADRQSKIADWIDAKLSEFASATSGLQLSLRKLESYRAVVIRDACLGRLTSAQRALQGGDDLSPGWKWERLGNLLSEPLRNGHSARRTNARTGVRTITLTAVTVGDFSERNTKLTVAEPSRVRGLWLRDGDLLIQRSNTAELVGTAAIYRGPENYAIYPDLLIRARLQPVLLPEFAGLVLQWDQTRNFLRERAVGVSGNMPKIDQRIIESIPIPLPTVATQREVLAAVGHTFGGLARVDVAVRSTLARAPSLRASIITHGIRGTQDVAA
jgi:type I restriction enzyme S subunit